jgi:hypothetical protein
MISERDNRNAKAPSLQHRRPRLFFQVLLASSTTQVPDRPGALSPVKRSVLAIVSTECKIPQFCVNNRSDWFVPEQN